MHSLQTINCRVVIELKSKNTKYFYIVLLRSVIAESRAIYTGAELKIILDFYDFAYRKGSIALFSTFFEVYSQIYGHTLILGVVL